MMVSFTGGPSDETHLQQVAQKCGISKHYKHWDSKEDLKPNFE